MNPWPKDPFTGQRAIDASDRFHIKRASVPALDAVLGHAFPVLDHGFVRVVDYMGDEAAITQAARVSYGAGTKSVSEDVGLIRYLMRHRHSTPFEMCEIKLHVKLPVFVARQWIRHRTANVNEYSARYSILAREFYVPEANDLAKQSLTNKQGRAEGTDDLRPEEVREIMRIAAETAFNDYEELVREPEEGGEYGLARELARIVTPVSTYTEWYWKIDMHNLMHFLSLRADPHAQKEIRVYADVMLDMLKLWAPNVLEAFIDYKLKAATFSRQEMAIIRDVFESVGGQLKASTGMSAREVDDFNKKVGQGK